MRVLGLVALFVLPALGEGEEVCAACHPKETARYLATPMGKSLGPPTAVPAGTARHARSGSAVTIEQREGKMFHRLSARGLTAEYEIAYQVGAGKFAHSYVVRIGDFLFESPATWFRAGGWDMSPGYAAAPVIDFDRPITETCLYCHAGAAKFSGSDERRLASPTLTSISCERCHGLSEEHVRNPSAGNILQPGKLTRRARDSVCEQCHLEGEARVLNRGRKWTDFHAGEELEKTMAVYVFNQNGHHVKPVNQVEQLAQSRCAVESKGRLWCGTCHNPHGESVDRNREMREVCTSCHATQSKAAHPRGTKECVSCHMPRQSSEYVHVAVTNHGIVRRPGTATPQVGAKTLAAWVEPAVDLRQRDLALANLIVGVRLGIPAITEAGLKLMGRSDDPALLAAACKALPQAVDLCRRAASNQPDSADRAMYLGIALMRSGDLTGAEAELRRAIAIDPSLKHAYAQLWTLYDKQRNEMGIRETMTQYLEWNPRNIMFRILRDSSGGK
jgi:Doubled CXXCH motif (Paired_CXXCH_1)/Cytochrome c554 and c-prime